MKAINDGVAFKQTLFLSPLVLERCVKSALFLQE